MTDEKKDTREEAGLPTGEVPIDAADFMGDGVARVAYDPPLDLGRHGKYASAHGGSIDKPPPAKDHREGVDPMTTVEARERKLQEAEAALEEARTNLAVGRPETREALQEAQAARDAALAAWTAAAIDDAF
jgi:hypothetical protein